MDSAVSDFQPRRRLLAALCALPWSGCARWISPSTGTSPLAPLSTGKQTVGLDIFFIRFDASDTAASDTIWRDVDEQTLPTEARRRLESNGLRAGVLGAQLPAPLERLLHLTDKPIANETEVQGEQLTADAPVRQRYIQVLAGRRSHVICTGESSRHAELTILTRQSDGAVTGRTFRKAQGILVTRAFPEPDGRIRLELMPEIEHGESQRRFESSDGILRVEFSPDRVKFDELRIDAALLTGQFLIVGGRSDRSGSLGFQYFTESTADRRQQKLLLIRPSLAEPDDLFSPDALPTPNP